MDFHYGENAEKLRSEIREFVKEYIQHPTASQYADRHFDDLWEHSMACSKKLADNGWLTMKWPKEYGGKDAPIWEQAVLAEEAEYWRIPGILMGAGATRWIGPSIIELGTEEQKKKYLPKIAAGEADGVWCTGYSEPNAGSDLAGIETTAIREGDEYVINGQKVWNSYGNRARYCWLACRTNPDAKRKHDGLSLIILDMKSEGITIRPIANLCGFNNFMEVFFKDVRVPAKNLVGVENNGWAQLMATLLHERGVVLGLYSCSKRIYDELVVYAKQTGVFKNREVRQKLAELAVDLRALKLLALESEWKADQGKAVYEPSRDKAYSDEVWERLSVVGTEIIGAYAEVDILVSNVSDTKWTKAKGMMETLYFDAPGICFAGGSPDTQRNIVAKFGLGLPKGY